MWNCHHISRPVRWFMLSVAFRMFVQVNWILALRAFLISIAPITSLMSTAFHFRSCLRRSTARNWGNQLLLTRLASKRKGEKAMRMKKNIRLAMAWNVWKRGKTRNFISAFHFLPPLWHWVSLFALHYRTILLHLDQIYKHIDGKFQLFPLDDARVFVVKTISAASAELFLETKLPRDEREMFAENLEKQKTQKSDVHLIFALTGISKSGSRNLSWNPIGWNIQKRNNLKSGKCGRVTFDCEFSSFNQECEESFSSEDKKIWRILGKVMKNSWTKLCTNKFLMRFMVHDAFERTMFASKSDTSDVDEKSLMPPRGNSAVKNRLGLF